MKGLWCGAEAPLIEGPLGVFIIRWRFYCDELSGGYLNLAEDDKLH